MKSIYQLTGKVLKPIKKRTFSKERELQILCEENMREIWGIRFLADEFEIGGRRFDAVGFDEANNAFIIIEFKNRESQSLVDQGYTYLNIALDRKENLILLYYKATGDKKKDDFDWESIRVYFVSPKFTEYQIGAVTTKMPFKMFEVNKFDDGIVSIEEISGTEIHDVDPILKNNKEVEKVNDVVKTYTEDELLKKSNDNIKEVYEYLKGKITTWDDVGVSAQKHYISFKVNDHAFLAVIPQTNTLKLALGIKKGQIELKNPNVKLEDMSEKGHLATGDYQGSISTIDDADSMIPTIKEIYNFKSR